MSHHGGSQPESKRWELEEREQRKDMKPEMGASYGDALASNSPLILPRTPHLNPTPSRSLPGYSAAPVYPSTPLELGSQSPRSYYVEPWARTYSDPVSILPPYFAASDPANTSPDGRINAYATASESEAYYHPTSRGAKADTSIYSSSIMRTFSQPYLPSFREVPKATLDKTYKVRNYDYKKFFAPGRVFSVLVVEPFSDIAESSNLSESSSVYMVAYGQKVHCKIRRVVVVRQHDLHCTCVRITSYANLAGKKSVHLENQGVIYSQGEPKHIPGVDKEPLKVLLSKSNEVGIQPSTLINYAQTLTVQLNWRVKDIGRLDDKSLRLLKRYFKEANFGDFDDDPTPPGLHSSQNLATPVRTYDTTEAVNPETSMQDATAELLNVHGATGMSESTSFESRSSTSRITDFFAAIELSPVIKPLQEPQTTEPNIDDTTKDLGPSFTFITKPYRFFVTGRVFKILWTEPLGNNPTTRLPLDPQFHHLISYSQHAFSKIRRFIVIRNRQNSCLCLPLFTYGGQGTSKSDVRPKDHAAVYAVGDKLVNRKYLEEGMEKEPFGVIVEEKGEKIDLMTRINFAQVYTVQHNVRVKRVGRVTKEHLERLNRHFIESVTAP